MGWLGTWDNRIKITIDNTNVDAVLSNFPIYLNISASSGIGSTDLTAVFGELTQDANRKKIAVTTSDGETQCYVEIERWDDANEKAVLWIKVPSVASGVETILYLYYDSGQSDNTTYIGDTGDTPAQSVWDANFKAVYHMAQDPNGDVVDAIKDSTSNANHGTPAGSMTSADLVDGKIGKAIDFEGDDDLVNVADDVTLKGMSALTVELMAYVTSKGDFDGFISKMHSSTLNTDRQYLILLNSDADQKVYSPIFAVDGRTSPDPISNDPLPVNTWKYVPVTYNGTTAVLYIDGVAQTTTGATTGNVLNFTNPLFIGAQNPANPSSQKINAKIEEVRISNTARSPAWIKATYYSNWDELVSFEFEEEEVFNNLNTEIKASEEVVSDLLSSVIAGLESLIDLNSEIKVGGMSVIDLKSDIAADFLTGFSNLSTEVSVKAQKILDLLTDIRAGNQILTDLHADIRTRAQIIYDLKSEIRAYIPTIIDLNTAIEAVRSKWWLKTEIKAGCAARWNFNTEWNPNRFLRTAIEAKKPYEFNFKTQADESYAATIPSVEFKVPEYSSPLRTLFLDYISVGGTNIYPFQLWWARGLIGHGSLKNAKIKAEYIDTQDSGGFEIVTLDWISVKVDDGEYQTVNTTPLLLGDIPCDSKLDITLKVECRDCSLTRGLAFFKLIIQGDYAESLYGDSLVYRDSSIYHAGKFDDYTSIEFICRLYVVG